MIITDKWPNNIISLNLNRLLDRRKLRTAHFWSLKIFNNRSSNDKEGLSFGGYSRVTLSWMSECTKS